MVAAAARVGVLCLGLLLACDGGRAPGPAPEAPRRAPRDPAPAAPLPADFSAPDENGWGRAGELRYLEVVKGADSPDRPLPLVVMIHGMGDQPRDVWVQPGGVPMRVVMPRATRPFGQGYSWFRYRVGDDQPVELARGMADAVGLLAHAIELLARHRPTAGRPVVGGFSQGGMLSYALATMHPQLIAAAFPVSGMLPRPLWPAALPAGVTPPPIRALHGDSDTIVPMDPARDLVAHLASLGFDATLQVYPGVPHRLTLEMSDRLGRELEAAAAAQAVTVAAP